MSTRRWIVALLSMTALGGSGPAWAQGPAKVEHPFILWTRDDLAAIKKRIETEPWARKAYEALLADKRGGDLKALFQYAVMGDAAAGVDQKKKLLGLLQAPDPLGGALEFRILAYDLLYADLTEQERRDLQALFRRYIAYSIKPGGAFDDTLFNNTKKPPYSRYDGEGGRYDKNNWLPNIIFPRKISANLMAVALRDEKLIRETWGVHGSIQWYFDHYLSDSGFYHEEFSKMGATPGALLLYCLGLKRLGLDELGLGYKGVHGATMRGHLESLLLIAYPVMELGTDRPRMPRMTVGDIRGYPPLEQCIVEGYFADGTGGNETWRAHGAWGGTTRGKSDQWDNDKTEKMQPRLWFEAGQKIWPDSHFNYFLAQMRAPADTVYYPTLFFNLAPIDPAKVSPPPAPSGVYPQRGVAMLRADESPSYWTSPAPAVGFRLTAPYAHSVNDALTISGFYAFNRPLYMNPHINPSYAFKFSRSIRSHAGVMVDGHIKVDPAKDWGQTGSVEPGFTTNCTLRSAFEPLVKFVACQASEVNPGVDQTRALMLTREYLLDVFRNLGTKEHSYTWIVHALGRPKEDDLAAWKPSTGLADLVSEVGNVRALAVGDQPWSLAVTQCKPRQTPANTPFTDAWYARPVGVKVWMLGAAGTTAYVGDTPKREVKADDGERTNFIDATAVMAVRRGPSATFAVVHEPFEGQPRLQEVRRLAETEAGIAVAVRGPADGPVNDRLLLAWGEAGGKPVTLAGDGERYTFVSHGFVRIAGETVTVQGKVQAVQIKAGSATQLVVNGQPAKATVRDGVLTWGD